MKMTILPLGFLLCCALLFPRASVFAQTSDLSILNGYISFSTDTFYAGETVRIYAKVANLGDVDTTGYVLFYQGGMLIGQSQVISLRAGGNPDDVFVDFVVPQGSFNIRAIIQGTSPQDTNPANDAAQTPLYYPRVDQDRDGVEDDDDNCVATENADQADQDHDGLGDVCDDDRDGDGVANVNDAYPDDASRSSVPVVVPVVEAAPSQAVVVAAPPAVTIPASVVPTATQKEEASTSTDEEVKEVPKYTVTNAVNLSTSPLARFSWKQIDWRTYEFTLAPQPEDGVRFSWDFGDGATSAQSQIRHAFAGPGSYTVTVSIIKDDGEVLSDAQTFDVTFFHLDNPLADGVIFLLCLSLFLFGYAFIKLRVSYDQSTADKKSA